MAPHHQLCLPNLQLVKVSLITCNFEHQMSRDQVEHVPVSFDDRSRQGDVGVRAGKRTKQIVAWLIRRQTSRAVCCSLNTSTGPMCDASSTSSSRPLATTLLLYICGGLSNRCQQCLLPKTWGRTRFMHAPLQVMHGPHETPLAKVHKPGEATRIAGATPTTRRQP
ncbi:hypothetical protein K491DRAFT_326250 [Lophiostoma macrostomum CBS 122681]|uniref:Uncharacterized protein n=1 Tax=Lophiostoma macrostomum CBS 122681 TaxID=1314788 RepID=A0A6A6TDJ9_9PLEO|nr:hypothetical protein K491DRAFT_326250 [Lophiostoma macrostomum CBS 122681]